MQNYSIGKKIAPSFIVWVDESSKLPQIIGGFAMIEGLKIDVSSIKLKDYLIQRAVYHKERAERHGSQINLLREVGLAPNGASDDPVSGLEQSVNDHLHRMDYFMDLADHLVQDETYRLSESHLARIEIISNNL
jgi:hypothetical protein